MHVHKLSIGNPNMQHNTVVNLRCGTLKARLAHATHSLMLLSCPRQVGDAGSHDVLLAFRSGRGVSGSFGYVFRGVPGGAEHFEVSDDFERVPAGVALRGPSSLIKMSCLASSRVWLVCALLFALWVLKVCEGEE